VKSKIILSSEIFNIEYYYSSYPFITPVGVTCFK
jgi:hypothetical protein